MKNFFFCVDSFYVEIEEHASEEWEMIHIAVIPIDRAWRKSAQDGGDPGPEIWAKLNQTNL